MPMQLSTNKPLTWKTCFPLAVVLAKRVSKLLSLSYRVCNSKEWFCTFSFLPNFITKTRTPLCMTHASRCSQYHHWQSCDGDRDEMLLCPIRAIKRYLSRKDWMLHFVLFSNREGEFGVLKHHLLWIRSVISHTYQSAADEDYRTAKVKAH